MKISVSLLILRTCLGVVEVVLIESGACVVVVGSVSGAFRSNGQEWSGPWSNTCQ